MYEYRFTLGMSSVDPAAVLFFPELFRHAHDAYEAFMAEVGVTLNAILAEGKYAVPIVHAEADYKRPLSHGTSVTVAMHVSKLGESSFVVDFDFRDGDGQSCATAKTVHVVIERKTGKRTTLPDAWRTRLEPHLERQR